MLPLSSILHLDQQALLALNFDGGAVMDTLMWWASDKIIWTPLYLLLVWLLWRKYGWQRMLVALVVVVLAVVLADQICNLFKTNLPKFRPTHTPELEGLVHTVRGYRGGLYGTVSAHAATVTSVAVFGSVLLRRKWWTELSCVWVAVVCYSRIYLGAHFPLDILCGITLGALLGWLGVVVWRRATRRWTE